MSETDIVKCRKCSWSGPRADLAETYGIGPVCPFCQHRESIDSPAEQAEQVEKKYCLIRPSGESPWMTLSPCDLWNHVEAGEEDEVWEVKWVMMTPKEVADLPEWEGW